MFFVELFFDCVILKGIIFIVLNSYCEFSGGTLFWLILGAILEFICSVAMGEWEDGVIVREILNLGAILMQVIPLFVLAIEYLKLPNGSLNFIMSVAFGWMSIVQLVVWFANAYEGMMGIFASYGASVVILIVNAIIRALFSMTYHGLLVLNFVVGIIAVIIMILARLALGSNME